jgi:hypothetical protein
MLSIAMIRHAALNIVQEGVASKSESNLITLAQDLIATARFLSFRISWRIMENKIKLTIENNLFP